MDDQQLHLQISALVEEEQHLRKESTGPVKSQALRNIEIQLDQCWDLLRQRQARLAAGQSLEEAKVRPPDEVENYLQ